MVTFNPLNPLENVTPRFTEEQLSQMIEWFDQNSKPLLVINNAAEPSNVITIEQFQTFLGLQIFHRRDFHYPSYNELMLEVEALSMEKYRMLIKDQFIYILDKWVLEPDIKHELTLAFKVFDTEKRGFLEVDLLRRIVTEYDDPFDPDEVIEFLRDANSGGIGKVYYEDFITSLLATCPELYDIEKEFVYEDPDEDPSVPVSTFEPEPQPPPPPPPPIQPQEGQAAAEATDGPEAAAPAVDPPAVDPPAVDPPAVDPPAVDPPA